MSLLRSARRVAVASAVHGSVQRRQRDRWAGATPAAVPAPAMAPATAATDGASDVIVQLERLGALRDSGVLTEAEFAAQKARILG